MILSETEIESNWKRLTSIVETEFPDRSHALSIMYSELSDRLKTMPASSTEHHHNAFPGGYVAHVLNVYDCALDLYEVWNSRGGNTIQYSLEELKFSAIHHDLGKAGFPGPGNETYLFNDSEWHRKNQGKIYKHNLSNPYANASDLSLYLLQHYNVPISWNEYLSIRIHDGLYNESNTAYYISKGGVDNRLKNHLPLLIHQADVMASTIEYEHWKFADNTRTVVNVPNKSKLSKVANPVTDMILNKAIDDFLTITEEG